MPVARETIDSVAETVEILNGLRPRFKTHHGVVYAPAALQAAVELAARHITDRHLPDKAIDVIDEAGAAQRIRAPEQRKQTIDRSEIEAIVAKIARARYGGAPAAEYRQGEPV